jgi:DNA-directed RNA polymerase specialized sigma24 family protein
MRDGSSGSALGEFERIYHGSVSAVTCYFARRCTDPQTVADLTSETIVRAAAGFGGFDPGRGTARVWLLGIAGRVYAQYCARTSNGRDAAARLAGLAELPADEIDELTDRIDAERTLELVDLDGLTPKEAAAALGVPRGVLRVRLSRARARLRKEHHTNE